MIPGIVASQMRGAGAGGLAEYLADSAVNVTAQNVTVLAPAGVPVGSTLFAILRCRGDRTFAVPAGWTALENGIPINGATSGGTLVYIFTRSYDGAADYAFVQSENAACTASIVAVRGALGGNAMLSGQFSTSRSIAAGSMLLSFGFANAFSTGDPTWTAPLTLRMSIKLTVSPSSYYGTTAAAVTGSSGSITASFSWANASQANRGVWTAEITPV